MRKQRRTQEQMDTLRGAIYAAPIPPRVRG